MCLHKKISKLVDHWLVSNVKNSDKYIKDCTDTLQNIQKLNEKYGPFPPETKLGTMGVVGLYTNISHEYLFDAITNNIKSNVTEGIHKICLVLTATKHVIQNNIFTFKREF